MMFPSSTNAARNATTRRHDSSISIHDLDPEEAASTVLENVQQRNNNHNASSRNAGLDALLQLPPPATTTTTTTTTSSVVKTRVRRLEAAMHARKQASEHVYSHVLQDMTTTVDERYRQKQDKQAYASPYSYYERRGPRRRGVHSDTARQSPLSSPDGLMKTSSHGGGDSVVDGNISAPNHHQTMDDRGEHDHGKERDQHQHNGYVSTLMDGCVPDIYASHNHNSTTFSGSGGGFYKPTHGEYYNEHRRRPSREWWCAGLCYPPQWMRECCAMIHPSRMASNVWDILVQSHFLWIGLPSILGAAVCYYWLDNPHLYFLPGKSSIAVWLLFCFRQTVTLGLSQMTVYIVIDGLMLGTHLAVRTLGPLITLAAATGKGWPAILTTWGVWNLILIHGTTKFQLNWLYWTHIELFNLNLGGYLVNSTLYTRCLAAAILGGLLVSAKRTVFALRFGRKQVAEFRPRLKRALTDVCLLDEISTLAQQTVVTSASNAAANRGGGVPPPSRGEQSSGLVGVDDSWSKLLWVPKLEYQQSLDDDVDDDQLQYHAVRDSQAPLDQQTNDDTPSNALLYSSSTHKKELLVSRETGSNKQQRRDEQYSMGTKQPSGVRMITDMLDSWERPEEADNEKRFADISIHEILKFRRALAHLDEDNVFGDAFGSTTTRDTCIANSHRVYRQLLDLARDSSNDSAHISSSSLDAKSDQRIREGVLPFEVLELLCIGDDGTTENGAKKRKIRKIFTPDRSGELPLLAFIQAVDQCYKRVVYLRASLRNSSLLDDVLERLFNGIFYFILVLFLSSVLELHPWTLMVSITSILVSVSFAFGSSVSAYVDGVLLIAIRRPYDLGDRIFVSTAEDISPVSDVAKISYFVEDITLATTTLRCARTNEVCTVNNSSIAGTRIVNLARSPNATVHFEFAAHISIFEGSKLDDFREELEKYVEERPRVWESVHYVRHGMFDADDERVDISIAVRHRCAWQEAGRIKNDMATMYRFLYILGNKIDVHFSAPPEQKVMYHGGTLRRGDTEDYDGRGLLARSNIRSIDPGHVLNRPANL